MWSTNILLYSYFITLLTFSSFANADEFECLVPKKQIADFVFIVDASQSMCDYVQGMKSGLGKFVNDLKSANINDSRFAIVTFGGAPILYQEFTNNTNTIINSLNSIQCSRSGQESSLETIRRVLLNDLMYQTDGKYTSAKNKLSFRSEASLNLFLVTDEDSDLPTDKRYYMPNQFEESFQGYEKYEPGWIGFSTVVSAEDSATKGKLIYFTTSGTSTVKKTTTFNNPNTMVIRTSGAIPSLNPSYQKEVDVTAELMKEYNARINILIKNNGNSVGVNVKDTWAPTANQTQYNKLCVPGKSQKYDCDLIDDWETWTGAWQFGSIKAAVQNDDLSNFDVVGTFNNLNNHGLGNSLQAQILKNGGYARVFDINGLTNSVVLNNFFSAAVELVNLCTSTVKWEEVGATETGNALYVRIFQTHSVTTTVIVPTTFSVTNTLVSVVTPTRLVTAVTTETETSVIPTSATETSVIEEQEIISETFNYLIQPATVTYETVETAQAETTESIYDSFTEFPTVVVVESFQTLVTEVISTDVSVTNSHSTLTSVSETEVVGKSVTDTSSFTETSVITEEFNKIYVYETVSPLVIKTVQAETTESVYDSFTESPTVTVVESFQTLVTEVISTDVSVTNSHSTLTSVSETKVVGKSTTTVVPVSETSIVVEQFDYLIQHETKVITDVLLSTVIKSETHYSSLFSTPVVSETTTKVIHATANAKATVTNVHHVTSVVAKTEVPVETSIIVENHTTVKPYTEVATETVTPVAESTSTVEDEEEGGGSSTVGIAAGVAAGGLAAAGAAAAAFYYYSPTNTVDSAGVFQDGGLSGGNVNPLYANDPSATLSSNVNPLYDN